MPLTLPFVFLRSNGCGDIELHCDQMKVLLGVSILLDDSGNFELVLMRKLLWRCFEGHYSRGSDFFAPSELIASLCASIIQYEKEAVNNLFEKNGHQKQGNQAMLLTAIPSVVDERLLV